MKKRIGLPLVALLLMTTGVSSGETVDLVLNGLDSGWSLVVPDPTHTDIKIDAITNSYVRIEIIKVFYDGPENGQFPANLVEFVQRLDDDNTVGTIQINDEIIINDTGWDWTDYHWEVIGDAAAFDRQATEASGFSVEPFEASDSSWGDPPAGWSSDHAATFDVDGGVVYNGQTFFPGFSSGKLYIDTDFSGDDVHFTLKQNPTPEPSTMAMLVGVAVLLPRWWRRRRSLR